MLEFPAILERLARLTAFSAGRERALALRPSADLETVVHRQRETAEAVHLDRMGVDVPLGGAHDVRERAVAAEPVVIDYGHDETLPRERGPSRAGGLLSKAFVEDAIADALSKAGYLAHGFTYSGHPVATAAALANLTILENEKLIERTRDVTGPHFQRRLRALASHPAAGEVRGEALIGAIELLPKGGRAALSTPPVLGAKAAAWAREEGVIVRGIRDLIAIAPPLVITAEEIDFLFDAVERVLDRVAAS